MFRVCSDNVTKAAICGSNESVSEIQLAASIAFTAAVSEQSLKFVTMVSKRGQEEELVGVGAQFID